MAAFGPNPGGMWVLVCVYVCGCVLDQPTAGRSRVVCCCAQGCEMLGGGGLITLILFTDAKENRANVRLKATNLKKRRDLPSFELSDQRNK